MRAAIAYVNQGLGTAILVGRDEQIGETAIKAGIDLDRPSIETHQCAPVATAMPTIADFLYARLQREGYLFRDCQRLVNNDRNIFARLHGGAGRCRRHGHRRHPQLFHRARRCPQGHRPEAAAPGDRRLHRALPRPHRHRRRHRDRTTCPRRRNSPTSPCEAAGFARTHGLRAARGDARLLHLRPSARRARRRRCARPCKLLDARGVDFEYDGEMAADVALNPEMMALYPFCRLSGPGQRAGDAGLPLGIDLDA